MTFVISLGLLEWMYGPFYAPPPGVAISLPEILFGIFVYFLQFGVPGMVASVLIGTFQLFVLARGGVQAAWLWLVPALAGGVLLSPFAAGVFFSGLGASPGAECPQWMSSLPNHPIAWAASGAAYGVPTGLALTWLRQDRQPRVTRRQLALALPPVAVLLCRKPYQAFINVLLTLLLWTPGVLHALRVVGAYSAEQRTQRLLRAANRSAALEAGLSDGPALVTDEGRVICPHCGYANQAWRRWCKKCQRPR